MPARAIATGTISFGLVSIPVKLFTAASSESISFNMLHASCGGRLKQQLFCPVEGQVVGREDVVKGFEYARDQYVRFTDDEIKAMESERSNAIEILEFVSMATVDTVHIEKSYYLGPDKGGDRAYRLLSEAMAAKGRVAVGRWMARGKDQLVILRPYHEGGLLMHQLHYANEVRSFDEIERGAPRPFTAAERELADKLLDELTADAFAPDKYQDSYAARVRDAIERKVQGQEITVSPEQPRAQIIDLFEALKQSLAAQQAKPGPAARSQLPPSTDAPASHEPRPLAKAKPGKATRAKTPATG